MNIVDSSGWLEYFASGPNASRFAAPLRDVGSLLVPVVSLYEVFKVVLREKGEDAALQVAMVMQKATVIEINAALAVTAAKMSQEFALPLADSMILATARLFDATIWTQDAHFKGLPSVKYYPKK